MKKRNTGLFLLTFAATLAISALMVLPACSSGGSTNSSGSSQTTSGVSYSRNIQSLFNTYCVTCHQGAGQAGLSLEPASSYKNLVGAPSTESTTGELRVKAGAPDQSYLLAKLNGTQVAAGGSGAQMPLVGGPLSAAQINLVQQWITAGAPNN
jgi:mono/diheme cytochrome c family protein